MEGGLYTRTPNIDRLASEGVRFTNFFYCGSAAHYGMSYTPVATTNKWSLQQWNWPEYKNVGNYLGEFGYKVGLTARAI